MARPGADPDCPLQKTLLEDNHTEFSQTDAFKETVEDNPDKP